MLPLERTSKYAIAAGPERAIAVVGVALGPWGPASASLEKAGATTIATSGRSKLEARAGEACEEKSKGCLLVAGNAAEQWRGKACHCGQLQLEGSLTNNKQEGEVLERCMKGRISHSKHE